MDEDQVRKFQKDLNGGLVALVLLAVLAVSAEDLYGYEIAKRLQRRTRARPCSRRARCIRCCARLSATGLLTSRIVPSYSGPPRRYYRITDEGRLMLEPMSRHLAADPRLRRSFYRSRKYRHEPPLRDPLRTT